jgi:hypothetical protein
MLRHALLLALITLHAGAAEVLTNEQILTMTRSGVASETILALISTTSSCQFATSPADIINLTAAKVPDRVIAAMVSKQCTPPPVSIASATTTSTAALESLTERTLVRLRLRSPAGLEGYVRINATGLTFCCRGTVWNEQVSRGGCGDSFVLPLDQVRASYLYAVEGENPEWILVTVAEVRYRFAVAPTVGVLRRSYSDFVVRAFDTLKALRPEIPSERLAADAFNKLLRLDPPSMEGHSVCDDAWNVKVQ